MRITRLTAILVALSAGFGSVALGAEKYEAEFERTRDRKTTAARLTNKVDTAVAESERRLATDDLPNLDIRKNSQVSTASSQPGGLHQVLSFGATAGTTGSVNLAGTLGQLVVGVVSGPDLNLGSGFWLSFGAGGPASCCIGRVGDANNNGNDEPDIADISVMIDHLFITQAPIACYPEADVNQSGRFSATSSDISISDISIIIDYLFQTGPSLGLADCL
jgi:hypothetical protein